MQRTPRPAALVVLVAIAALLVASGATGNSKAAPENTKEPFIASQYLVKVGSSLAGNKGTWTGKEPITYTYQWLRCNDEGEACKAIAGETATDYTITKSDVGHTIKFRVNAKNPDESHRRPSNATQQIQGKAGRRRPLAARDHRHADRRSATERNHRQLERHEADHLRDHLGAV